LVALLRLNEDAGDPATHPGEMLCVSDWSERYGTVNETPDIA
jgi:hypothetical protein